MTNIRCNMVCRMTCPQWLVLMGNCRVSAVMISRLMLNLRNFYGTPPTQRESRGNESLAFADISGVAIDETMSVAWIFSSMWIIWLRCQFTRWLCLMVQTTMVPSNRLYNMMGHSQIYRFAPDMAPHLSGAVGTADKIMFPSVACCDHLLWSVSLYQRSGVSCAVQYVWIRHWSTGINAHAHISSIIPDRIPWRLRLSTTSHILILILTGHWFL